jgi:hypothetical protein
MNGGNLPFLFLEMSEIRQSGRTENPRVGGSIPPLGTSIFALSLRPCYRDDICSNQSATTLCNFAAQIVLTPEPTRFLILAVMVDFD